MGCGVVEARIRGGAVCAYCNRRCGRVTSAFRYFFLDKRGGEYILRLYGDSRRGYGHCFLDGERRARRVRRKHFFAVDIRRELVFYLARRADDKTKNEAKKTASGRAEKAVAIYAARAGKYFCENAVEHGVKRAR